MGNILIESNVLINWDFTLYNAESIYIYIYTLEMKIESYNAKQYIF